MCTARHASAGGRSGLAIAARLLGLAWLLGASLACSDERGPPATSSSCDAPGLAFRIQLTAPLAMLPEDVKLVVEYMGSQRKVFPDDDPSGKNDDVCCRLTTRHAQPYPATECGMRSERELAEASAILCDVWSNGAARVSATAAGWVLPEQQLQAQWDANCDQVQTQDVALVMMSQDAGAPE